MENMIEVNGESYTKITNETTKKQIVVLQRGWVVVGYVTQDGDYLTVTDASVVRRWGTEKGLGELATNGPLEETVLDPCPANTIHVLTTVTRIDCDESKW